MNDQSDPIADPFEDDAAQTPIAGARPVTELMTEEVPMLSPTLSLRDAATEMRKADVSLAVVHENGGSGVGGVISERDIVRAVAEGLDLDTTDVAAVETEDLKWAAPDSSIDDVAEEMLECYVRHILVTDGAGGVGGVVSMRDVLVAYLV